MTRRPLLPLLLLLASPSFAADLRVDANNATGVEDGSALRPFSTIAAAVAAADSGDRLLVAAGEYVGGIRVENETLSLLGGYAGGSTAAYAGGEAGDFATANPAANPTILQGTPENAVVLFIDAGESRLEGFVVRGGGGAREDAFRRQGGGVFIAGGAPTIENNVVEANDARSDGKSSFGGGIYSSDANSLIVGNAIRGNQAGRGAGIAVSGGEVVIRGNIVEANLGNDDHGGGLYIFSPNALIENNRIFGNEIGRELGYGWGGGIIVFNPGANATLRNNDVYANFSPSRGAGVFIDEGATAVMEHCRVYANLSFEDVGAGGVYVDPGPDNIGSTLTMRHCVVYGHRDADPTLGGNGLFVSEFCSVAIENSIFWGNDGFSLFGVDAGSIMVRYSTTEEVVAGEGNLTGDPLFADPDAGDFHLRSTNGRWDPKANAWVLDGEDSPCIDAAHPKAPYGLEPDGNGDRANQGAYGNTAQASRTSLPGGPPVPSGVKTR